MSARRVTSLLLLTQLCTCAPVRIAPYASYKDSALHPQKDGASSSGALPGEFFCSDLQESANDHSAGHSIAAVVSGTLAAVLTITGGLVLSHANGEVPTRNVGLGLGVAGLVSTLPTLWFASRAGAASEAARQAAIYRTGQLDGVNKPTNPEQARAVDEVRFARCATILGSWQDRRSAVSEVNGRLSEIVNQNRDAVALLQQQQTAELDALKSTRQSFQAVVESMQKIGSTELNTQKLSEQFQKSVSDLSETISKLSAAAKSAKQTQLEQDTQKASDQLAESAKVMKAQLDALRNELSLARTELDSAVRQRGPPGPPVAPAPPDAGVSP